MSSPARLSEKIRAINIAVQNAEHGKKGMVARILWDDLFLDELYAEVSDAHENRGEEK